MSRHVCIALSLVVLASCAAPNETLAPHAGEDAFGAWGIQLEHVSRNIAAGDNFYRYVNGGWLSSTPLPPGASMYGAPWAVQNMVAEDVRTIIDDAAATHATRGTPAARVRDVYQSFLDTQRIEERGVSVLARELAAMQSIATHEDVARWMGDVRSSSIFHLRVQPPIDMQGTNVLSLLQYRVTGLGLPGQVYYLSDKPPYPDLRTAYTDYIATILELAGIDDPAGKATQVLALETQYAAVMWDLARLRDAGASFNPMPRTQLDSHAPGFPWSAFLGARGVDDVEQINVGVGAIPESAALFETLPVESWKSYLMFHWIDNQTSILPRAFDEASFAFFNAQLSGVREQQPRDVRALNFVKRHLGDDVGRLYVHRYFPATARSQVLEIAQYVQRAFRESLQAVDWMDDATRDEAIAKLDAVIFELGAPAVHHDWSSLRTDPSDVSGNLARIKQLAWDQQRRRIGTALVRFGDWNMDPHQVGAGYHQQYNKIFITAGALRPPFFNPAADPAVNFGAVGHTIAHELGHALDDQGSQFDRHGALRDWWTAASREAYEQRTRALIRQYASYVPIEGTPLNAEQMIGEIVGDLTGTIIAYRAYQLYIDDHGEPPTLSGYTGNQRFFMATAQQYRMITTEEVLRNIALHSAHPPSEYRINGVLTNFDPWYADFSVTPNAAMFTPPATRVRLW